MVYVTGNKGICGKIITKQYKTDKPIAHHCNPKICIKEIPVVLLTLGHELF